MDYTLANLCIKEKRRAERTKKVRMQKIVYGMMLGVIAILIGLVGTSEVSTYAKETEQTVYAKACIITKLDYKNDTVVCEDVNGFEWEFEGIMDYDLGDIVALVMDTNGTEIIFDDIIVSTKYDGVISFWTERGFE